MEAEEWAEKDGEVEKKGCHALARVGRWNMHATCWRDGECGLKCRHAPKLA